MENPVFEIDHRRLFLQRVITPEGIQSVKALAERIWPLVYCHILGADQIDYMMKMMYRGNVIQNELGQGVEYYLVLDAAGRHIGYFSLYQVSESVGKLDKLYLVSAARGGGRGQKLLNWCVSWGRRRNLKQLILNVNKNNSAAQKAYLRANWKCLRSECNDIGNGFVMDDFVFGIDL